jgi:hypothetical protein
VLGLERPSVLSLSRSLVRPPSPPCLFIFFSLLPFSLSRTLLPFQDHVMALDPRS